MMNIVQFHLKLLSNNTNQTYNILVIIPKGPLRTHSGFTFFAGHSTPWTSYKCDFSEDGDENESIDQAVSQNLHL